MQIYLHTHSGQKYFLLCVLYFVTYTYLFVLIYFTHITSNKGCTFLENGIYLYYDMSLLPMMHY